MIFYPTIKKLLRLKIQKKQFNLNLLGRKCLNVSVMLLEKARLTDTIL
jgi:hypothetical protein